ncbi:DUF1365 domain-containing protein [Saccharopolyspora erythraea]|uniref:DUF1365 domain-containing protein n=1 Tax=Saccharopolyspora erythraea TaxID=1836 RepID=UPI001BA94B12|nr:DUF1365 domain-containing protein [Saccharopolyspora erythraea]QUH05119.1 DUF1365 domain-containing protein [Saccharopolyspora erythraea]
MTAPALYDVIVTHTRHVDRATTFRHRLYTWLVDLDALPRQRWWLRPFTGFHARDHLGSPHRSIRENVDAWLALHGVDLRGGKVLMLAHARVLGHVFNPLTVYWCHDSGGELACVLAEVHNTYGERHCYLLRPDSTGGANVEKRFYVSPFLPERGRYAMRFDLTGQRVRVRVQLRDDDDRPLLTAVLAGRRRPANRRERLRLALRRPLVPQRVSVLIRRHGIALWLRRIPVVPRRPHVHQEGIR